jgi:hypothetical protein
MAITHSTTIRDGIANLVVDAIDAGGAGTLEFQTSGDVEVATLTFAATAFGASSSGTATAAAITSDTDATGGTVAKFVVKSGGAATIFSGAVATTGSDINLSSLTVGAGDTVSISALTYSAPA